MKITAIETIPVDLPVGTFRDGMDKVLGQDAPDRYYQGKPLTPRRWRDPQGHLVLSNVIVKIDTDSRISGTAESARLPATRPSPWTW